MSRNVLIKCDSDTDSDTDTLATTGLWLILFPRC